MSIAPPRPPRLVTPDDGCRLAVWRAHGASHDQALELLAYADSPLRGSPPPARTYPLPDAPCVADWERYIADARAHGALAVLRRVLVQLRFPIAAGISQDPAYQAATRRGRAPDAASEGVSFADPDGLRLFLHPTPAGRVPVVLAEAREDFDALMQAITHRNEPVPVPASMGACLVAGYNNWERVAQARRAFEAQHPGDRSDQSWAAAFHALIPRKERYQDRFMLLSAGPYSSTPAHAMRLSEADWRAASIRLRMAHECTHYFTRQVFGFMRMSLLDELVADYFGLVEALGAFRAEPFLRFMGLEAFPAYRDGGRLQNYRGVPPLSEPAFVVLQPVVKQAAENLERLDPSRPFRQLDPATHARVAIALMRVGLEGLASDDAADQLAAALEEAAPLARTS